MEPMESLEELRSRLNDLQRRLDDVEAEMRKDARVPADQRAQIGVMREQTSAVTARLPAHEGSNWDAVKGEVKRDLDALAENFQHMVSYIDRHFRAV